MLLMWGKRGKKEVKNEKNKYKTKSNCGYKLVSLQAAYSAHSSHVSSITRCFSCRSKPERNQFVCLTRKGAGERENGIYLSESNYEGLAS